MKYAISMVKKLLGEFIYFFFRTKISISHKARFSSVSFYDFDITKSIIHK